MEVDSAVISEAAVAVTSSWSEPSVVVGMVTAGLFVCVLIAQILATRATFRAANSRAGPSMSPPMGWSSWVGAHQIKAERLFDGLPPTEW